MEGLTGPTPPSLRPSAPPLVGARPLSSLRADCRARGCAHSLSDSWRVLELRLLVDQKVSAASDPKWLEGERPAGQELEVVSARWLAAQDGPLLPRRTLEEVREGVLSLEQVKRKRARHGRQSLPLIELSELWADRLW